MAGTWLGLKSGTFFFWQNFRILARKSVFCYRTQDFVNGPFVALGDSFNLAPSDPFLNFSFPSYGRFREGDPQNGDSQLLMESTPNYGPISKKFGQIVWFTKKMT